MALETMRPNGAGYHTQWEAQYPSSGSHYDKVDEASADDESTYVSTLDSSKQRETFALSPSSIPAGSTINSVTVYFRLNASGLYTIQVGPMLRLSGTDLEGTKFTITESGYSTRSRTIGRPGGGNWGLSDLEALEAGVYQNGSPYITLHLTQLYIQVDYTPPAGYGNTINGVDSPSEVLGVAGADIAEVIGV